MDEDRYNLQAEYQDDMRAEARESLRDSITAEFEMSYSDRDVLKDMVDNGDWVEMIDLLGEVFDEHKQMMIDEYAEMRLD